MCLCVCACVDHAKPASGSRDEAVMHGDEEEWRKDTTACCAVLGVVASSDCCNKHREE